MAMIDDSINIISVSSSSVLLYIYIIHTYNHYSLATSYLLMMTDEHNYIWILMLSIIIIG